MGVPKFVVEDSLSIWPKRVITLEEHFTTAAFLDATRKLTPAPASSSALEEKLLDLASGRLAAMDEGSVDLQILSLAAGGQQSLAADEATMLVRDANDAAFAATKAYPDRFAAFASLALKQPDQAAKELERGVASFGAVGGFVNGTEGGAFLEDKRQRLIHVEEICARYGYREFGNADVGFRLTRWVYALCWAGTERPSVLFDRATAWMLAHKVLLPGASLLERFVAKLRSRVEARLWRILCKAITPEGRPLDSFCFRG